MAPRGRASRDRALLGAWRASPSPVNTGHGPGGDDPSLGNRLGWRVRPFGTLTKAFQYYGQRATALTY